MKKQELEQQIKKLKKFNKIYISIIILGVIGCVGLIFLYLNKNIIKNTKIMNSLIEYRNKVEMKFNYDYEYIENNHNSAYKLNIKSAYGDTQGVHPKVLNFEKKWNGYKSWMVFSPYPNGNDKYENPHIVVSNDLINWEVPKGLKNPIEDTPKNYEHEYIYNSDPHLVYNYDLNQLEVYFRFVNDRENKMILYRKTSKDGIKWTEKESIITTKRKTKDIISPAIIYEDGIYKMWYIDRDRTLKYTESLDGQKYDNERIIKLNYPIAKLTNWHLDVIKTEKGYEIITVAYKNWKDRNSMNLYYFQSKDNISYSQGKIILRPSLISWDNRGIYRSSFIYEDGKYYVYYSAISTSFERGIGMSYGEHIENLIGSNIKEK